MSISSCFSLNAQLILLLLPVPKSIMMCCSSERGTAAARECAAQKHAPLARTAMRLRA
jgi:hypothetical protein